AVLGGRAVAGEQHDTDVGGHPRVVERSVELVDRVRPEGVAHLGPVEGDPHAAQLDVPVVGDVGEVEALHLAPLCGVERVGRRLCGAVLLAHAVSLGEAGMPCARWSGARPAPSYWSRLDSTQNSLPSGSV